jgi:hypothetical protein
MAQRHPTVTATDATAAGSEELSSPPAADLSAAINTLNQAAQALTTTVTQMMQMMHTLASGPMIGQAPPATGVPATQINTWEDDPFSEAVPTQNPPLATPLPVTAPVNANPLLQTHILDPQPPSGQFPPGTPNFRFWMVMEALARGINFWAPLLPTGTRWSTVNPMHVTLDAGEDLNAFYSRDDNGLFFFHQAVKNRTMFSADSPDVVCHELGHAILDALKPQLFDAASTQVAAFHEAFGDMSSILCALQLPSERQKVLTETQGRLNVTSRLSRLAEQLGWAIRQLAPTAVDPDCLRNAANRFFYQPPAQLPPQAPASQLSSEVHSFSRVFTGAFLDTLAGMLKILGSATDANLLTASRALGQLLVDGVHTAPVTSAYYSQVAAAMIQADQARNQGRYRTALSSAFLQRGILSTAAAATLTSAPVPQRTATPADLVTMAGLAGVGGFGGRASGAQSLLTYNGQVDDGYRRGPEDAPTLPTQTIATDFGMTLLVHAPAEPERFSVVPAVLGGVSAQPPTPDEAARAFVEDLIQLDRLDLRAVHGRVSPELIASPDERSRSRKTHVVRETPEGLLLKRLHFDCGIHSRP